MSAQTLSWAMLIVCSIVSAVIFFISLRDVRRHSAERWREMRERHARERAELAAYRAEVEAHLRKGRNEQA